jgi:hypothetical protein
MVVLFFVLVALGLSFSFAVDGEFRDNVMKKARQSSE